MIYELGVQAMVARNYPLARHYFTLYGREYPGRTIMSAIGISYLAEAMQLRQRIVALRPDTEVGFNFPLLLDAGLEFGGGSGEVKRSATDIEVEQLRSQLKNRVEAALFAQKNIEREKPENNCRPGITSS